MSAPSPRAAYIHIPFCVHRCGYCNFTVVAGRDDLMEPYLEAITRELSWLEYPRPVETLYFGGGTPTSLSADQLRRLCQRVLQWHPLEDDYEWTVEANPADLDPERMQVLAESGVNRLSLGAQSFHPDKLKLLERDHDSKEILHAAEMSRQVGLDLSIDLIFGTAGETLTDWQKDLALTLALRPDHISTYGLTYERGTQFWNRLLHGELAELPEELQRDMYLTAIDTLQEAGFEHYEVSNFARPGKQSRHNNTYWSGAGYFAAGPGAARYVSGVRQNNHRSTTTYLRRVLASQTPVAEEESLSAEARARETLIFGLRRLAGIDRQQFYATTNYHLDQLAGEPLRRFVQLGLLTDDGKTVSLTREGLLLSDSLWPELL